MQRSYRPDIDGLRAIAVLSVMAFHYGPGPLTGGFSGVDIFFVISGFLITLHLRQDIEARTFSIAGFYDRRIRRVVPALLVMLTITLLAGWWFLMPGDYASLGTSSAYAAAGLGNFYFLTHTGYFDRVAGMQPLLHTWSLGVEEQFYVAWPPLLWLALRLVRSRRLFVALFALALVAAFAEASLAVQLAPKAAFYLPLPRAWELAAGGILAFLPAIRARWLAAAMEATGAALIGWSVLALTRSDPFPGFDAAYSCCGAALLLWPKPGWAIRSLLSLAPMRWIGLISYSLYLWHWPVLVFFRDYNEGVGPGTGQALALAALAILLATLSFVFVERPIRYLRPARMKTVAVGVVSCVAIAGVGLFVRTQDGFASRIASASDFASLQTMWAWHCPTDVTIDAHPYCSFGAPWTSAKVHAMLWGDSHAKAMAPVLQAAYRNEPVSFIIYSWCPAVLGAGLSAPKDDEPKYAAHCREQYQRATRLLDRHRDIRLVIFSTSWSVLAKHIYKDGAPRAGIDGVSAISARLQQVIAHARTPGRRFVIVSDWPQLPHDPVGCEIGDATVILRRKCTGFGLQIRKKFNRRQAALKADFAGISADDPAVTTVFGDAPLCQRSRCSLQFDGRYLYRDISHIRRNLPASVAAAYGKALGFPILPDTIPAALQAAGR